MTVPPPALGSTPRRDYGGWCLLVAIFVLTIWGAVAGQKVNDKQGRLDAAEAALQSLVQEHLGKGPEQGGATTTLADVETALGPYRLKDPRAAMIDSAARTLLGTPVDPAAIQAMRTSKSGAERSAAEILSSSSLTPAQASSLSAALNDQSLTDQLVSALAAQRAGDPRALQALGRTSVSKFWTVAGIIAVLGALSLAAWIYVLGEKSAGRLQPLGFKVALPSLFDADRLALRAALLIFMYLVLGEAVSLAVAGLRRGADEAITFLVTAIAMLIGVVLLFRTTIWGKQVTLADIGVDTEGLAKNVRIGLLGFLLELPLAMTLAVVGSVIFAGLHPTHPATQELQSDHRPFAIFSVFFFGAIVAPFWEEIMFRGLLFPALSRVTGRVLVGAVVSSLLFGAVHPQGLPLWMALMAVAGMSCALTYHTRSLVPSIVMHGAHNLVLLTLTLLYS